MFGGVVINDGLAISTNNVYIFNVTHNTIVSYYYYHVYSTCLLSHISFIISFTCFCNLIRYYVYVYVFSIGRVLKRDQYLVRDSGLWRDMIMLVLLSMVTLPHLH